jgi:hypothetical protein
VVQARESNVNQRSDRARALPARDPETFRDVSRRLFCDAALPPFFVCPVDLNQIRIIPEPAGLALGLVRRPEYGLDGFPGLAVETGWAASKGRRRLRYTFLHGIFSDDVEAIIEKLAFRFRRNIGAKVGFSEPVKCCCASDAILQECRRLRHRFED